VVDLDELHSALEAVADPSRAPAMAAYMKDRFSFLGVSSTDRRRVQGPFVAETLAEGPDAALAAAGALWLEPERELQYVACDLLRRAGRRLPASALGEVHDLVASKSWWDTVDSLAKVVGDLVLTHPELAAELDSWVLDDDLWVARAAILHQLGWKERACPEVVFRYCGSRIDEPDFFIRKAIGWALRDLARTYPEEVWAWVDDHPGLSGLSRREATKHRR
jgi:3-methyladenine DNA glycosylase AlkD